MLTEEQVQRSFRGLFRSSEFSTDSIEKAEELIDQLRLESPLRHRLSEELNELRKICVANNS